MDVAIRPLAMHPGALTLEAVDALRALEASGHDPLLLGYHPVARSNPYQSLLYGHAWEEGIAPLPMVHQDRIDELTAIARQGYPVALHLHWLKHPLAGVTSAQEADRSVGAFIDRIDRLRDAGGRLVWTIHNILSHGAAFETQEVRLHAATAARAEVIHVLAANTRDHVAPFYDIPAERVLHVPHPSYIGAYPDHIGRDQARHLLGLMPDELVVVALGAIQAYKGLDDLLDAWDSLPPGPPRRLIIAGAPSREPGIPELVERAALHPGVLVHASRVPASEVQVFMRAADVAVLAHHRGLNSGTLLLALSFGVPAIVPAGGGIAELADERYILPFQLGEQGALARAIGDAGRLATPEARAAARAAAERLDPARLSRQFARELRGRLGC